MFYYLLYNSSFSFIVDNRLFSTVLYGSILYILTHAILNYCKVEILEIINNYFWLIFILDIISLAYGVYQTLSIPPSNSKSSSNLDVSFNLLKNQINTISTYFNKKNDISITDNTLLTNMPGLGGNTPVPIPRQPLRISTSSPSQSPTPQPNQTISNQTISNQTIPNQQYQHSGSPHIQSSGLSTPITALREHSQQPSRHTQVSNIPEPIITTDESSFGSNEYSYNNGKDESIAGSDVGSIMDLDDFEKNL